MLASINSGNTFGGEYWSDGREVLPMWIFISPVQKCPRCGRYAFLKDWEECGSASTYMKSSTGHLPYPMLKVAAKALLPVDKDLEVALRLELLWGYNDLYMMEHSAEPSAAEAEYAEANRQALLSLFKDDTSVGNTCIWPVMDAIIGNYANHDCSILNK